MAHWIIDDRGFGGTTYTCSDCECVYNDLFWDICSTSDCPDCGAVMTEDDNVYVKYVKHSRVSHVSECDRDTALAILKEFSRDMRPDVDIFGNKTLVIDRDRFEAIRKKYLDRK